MSLKPNKNRYNPFFIRDSAFSPKSTLRLRSVFRKTSLHYIQVKATLSVLLLLKPYVVWNKIQVSFHLLYPRFKVLIFISIAIYLAFIFAKNGITSVYVDTFFPGIKENAFVKSANNSSGFLALPG